MITAQNVVLSVSAVVSGKGTHVESLFAGGILLCCAVGAKYCGRGRDHEKTGGPSDRLRAVLSAGGTQRFPWDQVSLA